MTVSIFYSLDTCFTMFLIIQSIISDRMAKITVDLDALDDQEIINEETLLTEDDLKKPTSSDLSKSIFTFALIIY